MSKRVWILGMLAATVCSMLTACTGDISQETFDQIQVGMPLSEVQGIMGADGEDQTQAETSISSAGVLGSKQSRVETWVWTSTDRKSEIMVDFKDGKVASKSKRGF